MMKAVLFWSGGKDSAMALHKVLQDGEINLSALVCTLNQEFRRVSMHGISEQVLDRQVAEMDLPLVKMWVPNEADNKLYEEIFLETCLNLKNGGTDTIVFGDIFLDDLRGYRERLLARVGLKAYFPLWQTPTKQLMKEFVELGFEALTCCLNTGSLDKEWIGRVLDQDFITGLPETVDPCGENGEFHTFCYAGPVFKNSVPYETGEQVFKPLMIKSSNKSGESGFLYLDIL